MRKRNEMAGNITHFLQTAVVLCNLGCVAGALCVHAPSGFCTQSDEYQAFASEESECHQIVAAA